MGRLMFLELTVRDNKRNKTIDNRHIYVEANAIDYMVRRTYPDNVHFTELFLIYRQDPLIVLESPQTIIDMTREGVVE